MEIVMRISHMLVALLVAMLLPTHAKSQSDRTQQYGFCWLEIGFTRHVSGIVQLPKDDFYAVFKPAFQRHLDATVGTGRNAYCYNEGSSYGAAQAEMTRIIDGNPHITFARSGWNSMPVRRPAETKVETREIAIGGSTETKPVPKGPTLNQLKYQRELEAHNARLAEIEKIKANTAAKHAEDRAAAERELGRHGQEKAAADAAQRRYQQELAEHQRKANELETAQDRERKIDWREAVIVCNLDPNDGQSQFGNWRCDGPLQMTYAKLGSVSAAPDARAIVSLSQACGGSREAVRDLGLVGSAHLFGCSFGLHPKSTSGFPMDAAAKHGITYVPGRAVYRCPAWKSACRTQ